MSYKPSSIGQGPVRYTACRFCGEQALVEVLAQHGARCLQCYRAYCAGESPQPARSISRYERAALLSNMREALCNPPAGRAWAHRLRERHEAGEILSAAQASAYRYALRGGVEVAE